jgi:hypothetical protein
MFVITDLVGSSRLPMHEELHILLAGAAAKWTSLPAGLSAILRKDGRIATVPARSLNAARDVFSATRLLLTSLPQSDIQRVIDALKQESEISDALSNALRPLSWQMLAEMRDAGMTIGSHTRTHPFLTNESEECVRQEVEGSRFELQRRLGVKADCFAYPGGGFNPAVVRAVADAGYKQGFSICRHSDPQHPSLTIPRRGLWEQSCLDPYGRFSPEIMSCQTTSTFDWMSRCTQPHSRLQLSAA